MKSSLLVVFLALSIATLSYAESNADLVNSKVERTIDLTTHLVQTTNKITVANTAKSGSFKSYTFVVEANQANQVAFIGAQVDNLTEAKWFFGGKSDCGLFGLF